MLCWCFLSALLAAGAVRAQTSSNRIVRIVVEGNQRTDAEQVLLTVTSRVGGLLDRETIAEDIRTLYALGVYSDIAVDAERTPEGYVLSYQVKEHPSVAGVEFEGNDEIDTDKLRAEVGIVENSIFTQTRLEEARQKILALYAKEGYFIAQVDVEQTRDEGKNQVKILFKIEEHDEVLIRKIEFTGNEAFTDNELKHLPNMPISEKNFLSILNLSEAGKYREEAFAAARQVLTLHYLNNGYVDVKILTPIVALSRDRKEIFITIPLSEGPQYKVGEITVTGDLLWPAEEILAPLESKAGEIFSYRKAIGDTDEITGRYADEGYAFANVSPLPHPRGEEKERAEGKETQEAGKEVEHLVDLVFQIDKGELVSINRILVTGNVKTRDNVIRREMKIAEGERYSRQKLDESRARIQRLGFFEEGSVSYTPERVEGHPDLVNIHFQVTERPTGSIQVGAGFSSTESFFAQASISQANLFGRGQSLSLEGSLGSQVNRITFTFRDPRVLDSFWDVSLSAFATQVPQSGYDRRTQGGSVRVGYELSEISPLLDNIAAFVGLNVERIQLLNFETSLGAAPQDTVNPDSLSTSVSFTVQRNTLNDFLEPTKGTLHTATVEIADNLFGLNRDVNVFNRFTFRGNYYYPLEAGPVRLVFVQKWDLGLMQRRESIDLLIQERFAGGGISNLRGFDTRSVGPHISGDNNVPFFAAGDKEIYFTSEVLFDLPFAREAGLRPVVFFDAGDVYADNEKLFSSMLYDVGFGLRWRSPLGLIRFEFGWPLNNNPYHTQKYKVSGPVFQFAVGPAF